jgi:hypothetical protein
MIDGHTDACLASAFSGVAAKAKPATTAYNRILCLLLMMTSSSESSAALARRDPSSHSFHATETAIPAATQRSGQDQTGLLSSSSRNELSKKRPNARAIAAGPAVRRLDMTFP